jgi:hypothetical protein
MKRIAITLIVVLAGLQAYAQNDVISSLFEQYNDNPAFTKVSISNKMFELFTKIDASDPDDKAVLDAIGKLKGLKVVAADSVPDSRKVYQDAVSRIQKKNYSELMSVKDGKEDMLFLIREKGPIIEELVMVAGGHKSFMVLSLYGEIDLNSISKLSKSMNIKGMEQLQKLDDNNQNKE